MARRDYSDEDRASALAALAVNEGNLSKTAQQCDVPRNTLRHWQKEQESAAGVETVSTPKKEPLRSGLVELVEVAKQSLADKLDVIAHKLADALPDKIDGASLQQCATSLGIAIDKMRLLREQPTAITQTLTDDERAKRLHDLEARVRSRLAAPVDCRGEG